VPGAMNRTRTGQNTHSSIQGESLAFEENFLDHLSPRPLRSLLSVVLPFDQRAEHMSTICSPPKTKMLGCRVVLMARPVGTKTCR
jgi:hypothetical protein